MIKTDRLRRNMAAFVVFTGLTALASGCASAEAATKPVTPVPEMALNPRYKITVLNMALGSNEIGVELTPASEDDSQNNESLTASLVEIGKHCYFDIKDIREVRKFVAGQNGGNPNILGPLIGARLSTRGCLDLPKNWEGNKKFPGF